MNMEGHADVVELCALLQCVGYKVKSMQSNDVNRSQETGNGIKSVVINCHSSGLQVVMETEEATCTCPSTDHQSSGFWQVSGFSGGKGHQQERGSALLGSLPKPFKTHLMHQLKDMVNSIKEHNDSIVSTDKPEKIEKLSANKSASMLEMRTTPEKCSLFPQKPDTPTRYRSLDTLTTRKHVAGVDSSMDDMQLLNLRKSIARRQSTYTVASTPGSSRRNKTSSPIHATQNNMLGNLLIVERIAEELRSKLEEMIAEYNEDANGSMASLALDVSKISLLKAADTKQFASSPNLTGMGLIQEEGMKQRGESASTSKLNANKTSVDSKLSKLKRMSPGFFSRKKTLIIENDKNDSKSKLGSIRPRIVTPVRIPKQTSVSSVNLSASKNKKYSHIKSTIPKPTYRRD